MNKKTDKKETQKQAFRTSKRAQEKAKDYSWLKSYNLKRLKAQNIGSNVEV